MSKRPWMVSWPPAECQQSVADSTLPRDCKRGHRHCVSVEARIERRQSPPHPPQASSAALQSALGPSQAPAAALQSLRPSCQRGLHFLRHPARAAAVCAHATARSCSDVNASSIDWQSGCERAHSASAGGGGGGGGRRGARENMIIIIEALSLSHHHGGRSSTAI